MQVGSQVGQALKETAVSMKARVKGSVARAAGAGSKELYGFMGVGALWVAADWWSLLIGGVCSAVLALIWVAAD